MFITSYKEEFQWPKQSLINNHLNKKRTREEISDTERITNSEPIYRNSETLRELTKECLLPFNYLLRDKPIIKTDPKQPPRVQELPKDDSNIFKTRPRVFKAPEISLDDINDLGVREKIIDYTYSTTYGLASKDVFEERNKPDVLTSTWEEPNFIRFNKRDEDITVMCEIEEGNDDGKLNKWEREQSRSVGDPTTKFWTAFRNNSSAKIIDQDVIDIKSPEFTRNIINLARGNKLRLPYCQKPGDYAGYLPECPIGIVPKKRELEISNPMQTVYTLTNRWREL